MLFSDFLTSSLKLMIDKFVLGIPNFIMAIIVLLIGSIISKTVGKFLKTLLSKVGVDKFGEKLNEIEVVYKSGMNIKVSSILSGFVRYFMLMLFIALATDILQMPALSNLVVGAIEFIPNLLVAIIIMIVGLLGADALRKTVYTTCTSLGIPSAKVISVFIFYFLFITIFIMALGQAKINTGFLAQNISIIIGGAVFAFALGYGLASKEIMSNFLGSMYSKDRVKIGDQIRIENIQGKVLELDKTSIVLETPEGKIIIPTKKMVTENITILN
jgi:hypothetical protein